MVGGHGEGGGKNEAKDKKQSARDMDRAKSKGEGEGGDGSEKGEQAPRELEESELREVMPEREACRREEDCDGNGEAGEEDGKRGRWLGGSGCREKSEEQKGTGCDGEEQKGEVASSVEYGVVDTIGGVVEEGVVVGAQAGEDGHGDLDEAALEQGRNEVEGGEGKGEQTAEGGVDSESGDLSAGCGEAGGEQEAKRDDERYGVGADDGSGGICKPEQGEREGEGGNAEGRGGLSGAGQKGGEKQGQESSGEEFCEGGALEGGEEDVGIGEVKGGGKGCDGGGDEAPGEPIHCESSRGEGEPGVDDGSCGEGLFGTKRGGV